MLGAVGWALFLGGIAWDLTRETREVMGFKREKKVYHLTFETPDLAGFECYVKGTTLEQFIGITALSETLKTEEGRTEANIRKQFTVIADHLQSWNLEDDDGPVACDYDGLKAQDFDFVMAIMMAWMASIASVPAPLAERSPSGETSPEASLHLASVSASLAS